MADAGKREEEGEGDHKMKLSVISNKENVLKALVENASPEEMNLLRRTIMYEVPIIAIEDVFFTKNESPLYDEIVAQRLGLVSLTTDLLTYKMPAVCSCKEKGCSACQVKLSASVSGPATVYARDLRTTDPRVKPVHPDTIITKLGKNQQISFEAVAVLGKGAEHVKWSPALVFYIHKPSVSIDLKKVDQKAMKEIVEMCPSNVFEVKSGKLSVNEEVLFNNPLASEQARAASEKFDSIKFDEAESSFILTIESWGQLPASELLRKSSEIIAEQLSEIKVK